MNALMNETQLWYCNICDKAFNNNSKSKHVNSKLHKHKENYGSVVRGYEFIAPDFDEVNYILNDTIKECRKNSFRSFEYRCVHDIKFTNLRNNEEVILTISFFYTELKSQFYGLSKKVKNAGNNGFTFDQIIKLTMKIDSSLSNINIQYYLNFPIPIMHRQFLKIISQNPDYVKTYFNDFNNPFHFACRKFI